MRITTAKPYTGRFAPSPTGRLHLGTLTAAVASFLHARQNGGRWLVRIEDIDPPREVAGSADSILRTLEALGLEWDGPVRYQSRRLAAYLDTAQALVAAGSAYYCDCSRQQIREQTGGSRYPGTCRDRNLGAGDAAIRARIDDGIETYEDGLQGRMVRDIAATDGDFVIVRRDGLPAYHLAVVLDDADQGVTAIVRGADLLDSTPLHRYLQRLLDLPSPEYWHVPIVTDDRGQKLAKRSGSTAVDVTDPSQAIARALGSLGFALPAEIGGAPPTELLAFACAHWRIEGLRGKRSLAAPISALASPQA